jgi:hypothetical protein
VAHAVPARPSPYRARRSPGRLIHWKKVLTASLGAIRTLKVSKRIPSTQERARSRTPSRYSWFFGSSGR